MKILGKVLFLLALTLSSIDYFLARKYCIKGFFDYPDTWTNNVAKSFHVPLVILSLLSILLSIIFLMIF